MILPKVSHELGANLQYYCKKHIDTLHNKRGKQYGSVFLTKQSTAQKISLDL